jgi:3D (Asp-Asp-Asp) domain-containing protein
MQPRFGYDFSKVRVHTGGKAAASADAVEARAYTVGPDIVFNAGQYAPGSTEGRRLLAHELAHTIQQGERRGVAKSDFKIGPIHDDHEAAADIVADSVTSSGAAPSGTLRLAKAAAALQRQPTPDASKKKNLSADALFELAGKDRTKWRVNYKTKAEAYRKQEYVKSLDIKADEPVQEGAQWTFYYYPLSEEEAKAAAAKKSKEAGKKYNVEVKNDALAKSYYVSITLKCPEAIAPNPGYTIWDHCFDEAGAKAQVKKFAKAQIKAEVIRVDEKQFGVYYRPMTEKEARAAGETAAQLRPGFAEGMYQVTTSENKPLKSFTYAMKTSVPAGYKELGSFNITSYVLAKEEEFPESPTVENPCGLVGTFREKFLTQTKSFPAGVEMQGSGKSITGKYIHYAGIVNTKACFEVANCPLIATAGQCATKGRTVAVDFDEIKKGKNLLIEDIGPRVAEDTGGGITGKHIDVYQGEAMSMKEAQELSYGMKKVYQKL